MNKEHRDLQQIKQSVANELKTISLLKKDRNLLLGLIELFDWLTEDENERFLIKLQRLILEKNLEEDEELKVRISSLKAQLDVYKNLEIRHFPTFSMYFQKEKVEIYLKKLPASWNALLLEIKKIELSHIQVYVYKSITKKETISSVKLKINESWEADLSKILDNNVYTNVRITLFYNKETL